MKKINIVFFFLILLSSGIFCCNKDEAIQPDEFINFEVTDDKHKIFHASSNINLYYDGNGMDHYISTEFDTSNHIFKIFLSGLPKLGEQLIVNGMSYLANDVYYHTFEFMGILSTARYSNVATKIGEYYEGTFQVNSISKENSDTGEPYGIDLTMNGSFRFRRKQ
jgi:hypothetical protein